MSFCDVYFLGVRGSIPCGNIECMEYGGHTSCVMIHIPKEETLVIFDAGSGIKDANRYIEKFNIKKIYIFLTHLHHDHLMGLPFFKPLWMKNYNVEIYCGTAKKYGGIKHVLNQCFSPPFFPVVFEQWSNTNKLIDFDVMNSFFDLNNIKIEGVELHHPNGSVGYKLTYRDRVICYITDHEHGEKIIDDTLNLFITNANLLIYDATYENEKYIKHHQGWGHSTWQQACLLKKINKIECLALFHHDPEHDDVTLKMAEITLQKNDQNIFFAKQSAVFSL